MGFSLAPLGKKLDQYAGDVGHFFGGAAQGLGHVANATGQAVGNAVLHAPVISQAVQFGQHASTPQFQQQGLPGQVADFTKGIFSTGYQNSPVGALERTGANIAATATQKPVVSLQGTTLPVNRQIQQAQPVMGNKLLGQGLAVAGVVGDAAYGAGGVMPRVAPVGGSLPTPKSPVTLKSALTSQSGRLGAPTEVPLNRLKNVEGQPLDRPRVDYYKQQYQSGIEQDPLVVRRDSQGVYGVEDGKHRLQALKELGSTTAPVVGDVPPARTTVGQVRVGGKFAKGPQIPEDDARSMVAYMDSVRMGTGAPAQLKVDAVRLANHYGIKATDPASRANAFDQALRQRKGLMAKLKAPLQSEGGYISVPGGNKPKVNLTSNERKMGEALGMSEAETLQAKAGTANALAPLEAKVTHANQVSKEEAAAVQNEIQRRATGDNNPMKVNIPKVAQGDYAKARSNAQLASNPIDVATGLAHAAIRRLPAEDKPNFFRAIEDPSLVSQAKDPAKMQAAINAWKELSDRGHATDRALGGQTPYRQQYALHDWNLTPEAAQAISGAVDPASFNGVNNIARIHPTIAHGEAAGLTLKNRNPEEAVLEYGKSVAGALKRQALIKGITEADTGAEKVNRSFDLRNGKTLPVSEQGLKELRSMQSPPEMGAPRKAYRAVNKSLKQTLLSLSQFHPVNISVLKAGPSLAGAGHPALAAKGVADTFLAISKKYSTGLQTAALKDGTIEAGARIGSPIKFGSDYASEGKLNLGKNGIGERTIFEQQMPAMHIQMVKGVMSDLEKRGISLDSAEARAAGTRINEIMGFVNTEVRNLDPRVQRGLGDALLAPQFTRSKWATLKGVATDKGIARKYATSAVVGNTAALLGVQFALGALFGQKQDNWRDTMIRALIHPSIATPFKDHKGNTIEFGLPQSYLSEALSLGVNLTRDKSGRLGAEVKPGNIPGNLASYGRNRLAVLPSDALKVATNTDYSNKPLYDPAASPGTKATQAATTLVSGQLPIGLQGLAQTQAVKSHLPKASQEVLNANDSGINPLLKSVGGAFGLSARADKTVGPALAAQQYYSELGKAKQGLNRQAADALDLYSGSKKNPVTGAYDVKPNVNDQRAKATSLLQNPEVIDRLAAMNKNLAANGQKVDPLWGASKDQITKYLQYQAMRPNGPDQKNWRATNPWYQPLQAERSKFFGSLPPGDPNKPKAPIEYPQASPQVAAEQSAYFALPDGKSKAQFMDAHPDLQAQFGAQFKYYNDLSSAQGYTPVKGYPEATPAIKAALNAKNYKAPGVQDYLNQISEYNVIQGGANAQFVGTDLSQSALKGIYSLGNYDITKSTDANGNHIYALGSSGGSASFKRPYVPNSIKSAIRPQRPKTSFQKESGGKAKKVRLKSTSKLAKGKGKAKVSLKSSMV